MAVVYAKLIIRGLRTYKSVPGCIKKQVKEVLIAMGLEELATEEE